MPDIVPILSEAIWDTKADVKKQARESLTKATALISNKDIEQFIPALIQSLINPVEEVFKTIQLLSATTFVSEVDSPTLSLMVLFWLVVSWKSRLPPSARLLCTSTTVSWPQFLTPLSFIASSTTCPSSSTRLSQFHPFLPKLLPGLIKVETTIGNPEACSVVGRAIATPSGWRGPYW
jgi:elongation factor 3